jgi:pimeloyl-ACP methyl ester carboxylesterase
MPVYTINPGRDLAYRDYGDPKGVPVIYCHGFPSSSLEGALWHEAACATGVHLIAPDRPGYGQSTAVATRDIADWSDDVAQLARQLHLRRFAVLGMSGGGPYAVMTAWRLQAQVSACALACPLGALTDPVLWRSLHWSARLGLLPGRLSPGLTRLIYGNPLPAWLMYWNPLARLVRSTRLAVADEAALAETHHHRTLNMSMRDALRYGAPGARQDLWLYTHNWHVAWADWSIPLAIWHGQADRLVPIDHAYWYQQHLPAAQLHAIAHEGHFSIPIRLSQTILKWLVAETTH